MAALARAPQRLGPPRIGPQRIGVVVNPIHARGTRAAAALAGRAAARGLPLLLRHTTAAEPGGPQARALVAAGCTTVVAVGGDGTVREVAYALAGTGATLGVVPTGTANLFARNLGLPRDPRERLRVALDGAVRRVDLGLARLDGGRPLPFLAYAGVGEDAATVAATRPAWKSRLGPLGWLAYLGAGARHLFAGPHPVTVDLDEGRAHRRDAWCVLVGSVGQIPGGVRVFPRARPDDGTLHVLEVGGDPARWGLVAAEGVWGRPVPGSGLHRAIARRVQVTTPTPLPVQLDGDAVGEAARVTFGLAPDGVGVRVGPVPRGVGGDA